MTTYKAALMEWPKANLDLSYHIYHMPLIIKTLNVYELKIPRYKTGLGSNCFRLEANETR